MLSEEVGFIVETGHIFTKNKVVIVKGLDER